MRVAALGVGLLTASAAAGPPRLVAVTHGEAELRLDRPPVELRVEGATAGDPVVQPLTPDTRDTDMLLHAPAGQSRALREIARGWSDTQPGDEHVRLVGLGEAAGGPALRELLATTFQAPLPDTSPVAFLGAPGGPDLRRVLLTDDLSAVTGLTPPDDGTRLHVVHLRRPGLSQDPVPDGLRARLGATGGHLVQVDTIEEGQARLARLREREPQPVQVRVSLCGATGPVQVSVDGVSVPIEAPLPACAPAASSASAPTTTAGDDVPWWRIAVPAGLGLVVIVGGGLLLLRRRPGPAADPEPAEPPGRLLAPVDPDADLVLRIRRGAGLIGGTIPLSAGRVSVGAAPGNDALVDLPGISGRHARFERFPGDLVFVVDSDSANGTWVDGRRLERGEKVQLAVGDRVALGPSLEVELVRAATESA